MTPFLFSVYVKGPRPLIIKISYFCITVHRTIEKKTLSWRVTERRFAKGPYHSEAEGAEPGAAARPSLA